MIITDEGMVCIEKALMTRPEKITHNGSVISASQLHTIGLDTATYPNAAQMFDRMLQVGKYEAWKNQSNDQSATFEQYLATRSTNNHVFETWAYKGKSDIRTFQQFTDDTYIILRFIANSDRDNILANTALEFLNEGIGDVLAGGIFTPDPAGIGVTDSFGTKAQDYYPAEWMGAYLARLGADIPTNVAGGVGTKYPISGNLPKMLQATPVIFKEAIPQFNSQSTRGFKSIFTVTGTPQNK
jgi:hypothetical protein